MSKYCDSTAKSVLCSKTRQSEMNVFDEMRSFLIETDNFSILKIFELLANNLGLNEMIDLFKMIYNLLAQIENNITRE
jgi:hypothetical protein